MNEGATYLAVPTIIANRRMIYRYKSRMDFLLLKGQATPQKFNKFVILDSNAKIFPS